MDDTWLFHVHTAQWQNVAANPRPPARFSMVAGVDVRRDRFIITTGEGEDSFFNDVWALNLRTLSWSEVACVAAHVLNR